MARQQGKSNRYSIMKRAAKSIQAQQADNRGQSLMELLMAFAVSAVVLVGLSALLFTGLRLYERGDVNAKVQNEAQNALNLLTDHMMEAKGVCMEYTAANPDVQCLLLDEIEIAEWAAGSGTYDAWFRGEAVIVQLSDNTGAYVGEMYMISFPIEDDGSLETAVRGGETKNKLATGASGKTDAVSQAREYVLDYFLNLPREKQKAWLMAEHVTACEIVPADSVKTQQYDIVYEDASRETEYYYTAPFGFDISMSVALQSQTGENSRHVEDTVYVRNRLASVYLDKDGGMKEYFSH